MLLGRMLIYDVSYDWKLTLSYLSYVLILSYISHFVLSSYTLGPRYTTKISITLRV
jgi:hypothetical protein